jgi:hypothetical protein
MSAHLRKCLKGMCSAVTDVGFGLLIEILRDMDLRDWRLNIGALWLTDSHGKLRMEKFQTECTFFTSVTTLHAFGLIIYFSERMQTILLIELVRVAWEGQSLKSPRI